jgi:hypothetical protein
MSKGEPEMAGLDILEPARLERERGRGETETWCPRHPDAGKGDALADNRKSRRDRVRRESRSDRSDQGRLVSE